MDNLINQRKHHHLEKANSSQTSSILLDERFNYEPLFAAHNEIESVDLSKDFLGSRLHAPIWVSSMTGGTGDAAHINKNLAKMVAQFGLGMGLGSCRPLLESDQYFDDFNLRPLIGNQPLYANLGIAQLESIIRNDPTKLITLLKSLQVDGLVIHLNPLQEWFQQEGDRYQFSPLETIKLSLTKLKNNNFKVIVKEVGQGIGPRSLAQLCELGIDAIEFAAFGGTNFSMLELSRQKGQQMTEIKESSPLCFVGHTALDMVHHLNKIKKKLEEKGLRQFPEMIISGGVKNSLDGYFLMNKCNFNSIYAHANKFLNHACGEYVELESFVAQEILNLKMANLFLEIKTSSLES